MKRNIVITIDADDERCGECDNQALSSETAYVHCELNGDTLCKSNEYGKVRMRGPACLAAERNLAALIAAGDANAAALRLMMGQNYRHDWDAAKKAMGVGE